MALGSPRAFHLLPYWGHVMWDRAGCPRPAAAQKQKPRQKGLSGRT